MDHPQSLSEKTTEILSYVVSTLTIFICLPAVAFSVHNYHTGAPRLQYFNLALLVLSIFCIFPATVDLIENYAFYDKLPHHSLYDLWNLLNLASTLQNAVEDDAWSTKVVILRNSQLMITLTTMNFHVVVFFLNFRNIRIITPFSIVWDYLLIGTKILVTAVIIVVFSMFGKFLGFYTLMIALLVMFIDTVLFNVMAVVFLTTLKKFIDGKRNEIRINQSLLSQRPSQGSRVSSNRTAKSLKAKEESAKRINRWLYLSGVVLWLSIFLMLAANILPIIALEHLNLASIMWRLSNLLLPVQFIFTLLFTSAVRKLMRSLFPSDEKFDDDYIVDIKSYSENVESLVVRSTNPVSFQSQKTSSNATASNATSSKGSFGANSTNAAGEIVLGQKSLSKLSSGRTDSIMFSEEFDIPSPPNRVVSRLINSNSEVDLITNEQEKDPDHISAPAATTNAPRSILKTANSTKVIPNGTTNKPQKNPKTQVVRTVLSPFTKIARNDEIVLLIGDLVLVEVEFKDGWALGRNARTGKRGYFPMNCFKPGCTSANVRSRNQSSSSKNPLISINSETSTINSDVALDPYTSDSTMLNHSRLDNFSDGSSGELTQRQDHLVEMTKQQKHMFVATNPSHSYEDQPVTDASSGGGSPQTPTDVEVAFIYKAQRDDELNLYPGDVIRLIEVYDDGWAMGTIVSIKTPKVGMFPLSVCKPK
ncbi:hypothetical protein HK098_001140 [Nowakowskiella sp. JEL0407]|nr:hypothetical protein HK098_001140 [Nowakowskiella sp. JEL0407]